MKTGAVGRFVRQRSPVDRLRLVIALGKGGHVRMLFVGLSLLFWGGPSSAADLFLVTLHSPADANRLGALAQPVLSDGNSYIVLLETDAFTALKQAGLDCRVLAVDVSRDDLAILRRPEGAASGGPPLLYENGELRLVRVPPAEGPEAEPSTELWRIPIHPPSILYQPPDRAVRPDAAALAPFDSLIQEIREDSVRSYLLRLQAFRGRVAATDSNRAAAAWIQAKFLDFGYDSVYVMPFAANVAGAYRACFNVIAVKVGATYPQAQIVVGAHFDGMPGSPAVDDNGTGTAGVLEMARVLGQASVAVTLVFVTFDAEEYGLHGSVNYAFQARQRGDPILFMWNMDMIGHRANSSAARLYHGARTRAAQTFMALAPSYGGITGSLAGSSGLSDHYPFLQSGYEAVFLQEWTFSSVYHSFRDSTSYINFDYVTRMIKASLATVLSIAESDDLDGDGTLNEADNCVAVPNATQADSDSDSWGDACDNCPDVANQHQADGDADALGDVCDACPQDAANDADGDTHCGHVDNCPGVYNPSQDDVDADGHGDPCDNCAAVANPEQSVTVSLSGDVDQSGSITVDDVLLLVNYLFRHGPPPEPCPAAGDADCSGQVGMTDIVTLVNYLFRAGAQPCNVCAMDSAFWSCR